MREIRCATCGFVFEYHVKGRAKKTCSEECRLAHRLEVNRPAQSRYHQEHRDERLAYMKSWHAAHPKPQRRQQTSSALSNRQVLELVRTVSGGKCRGCGEFVGDRAVVVNGVGGMRVAHKRCAQSILESEV